MATFGLKGAEPEEENFFKKFKTDRPAEATEKFNEERWARDLVHPVVPLDDRAVAAARRLTASTNRSPVPPRHRIRVAAALGSALSGSAALTADQRHALGAP